MPYIVVLLILSGIVALVKGIDIWHASQIARGIIIAIMVVGAVRLIAKEV